MKQYNISINTLEHCPDCGSLLITVPAGLLCAYCGLEWDEPEEILHSTSLLPSSYQAEGRRFHLMDEEVSSFSKQAA